MVLELWAAERRRLGTVCTAKYPFDDMSTAAAYRDLLETPSSRGHFRVHTFQTVLWLCRFVIALLVSLVRRTSNDNFGIQFHCQETRENLYLKEKVERAVSGLVPARFGSGDLRTLVPFLAFEVRHVDLDRWWLRVPCSPSLTTNVKDRATGAEDDEACALDVAWPPDIRGDGPTFLVLHGLNGGSDEKYVRDFLKTVNRQGSVAAVLIARGCMSTPVRGTRAIFSGARTCDVASAVGALRTAIPDRPVCVVGFSMGGIIAANYAVQTRSEGRDDSSSAAAVVCVSGSLCLNKMLTKCGDYSKKVWQPPLVGNLRKTFLLPSRRKLELKRRGKFDECMDTSDVQEFDAAFVAFIHGYKSVSEYYEQVGAAGRGDLDGNDTNEKFSKLDVPLLVLHARDDPIIPFDCICADHVARASPKVTVLSTKVGGHVGWPAKPYAKHRWDFMIQASLAFCNAAASSR